MMRFSFLSLLLILTASCTEFPDSPQAAPCILGQDILPPDPFAMTTVGTIEADNSYHYLGASSATDLYAMGTKNAGGFPDVYLSEDGGMSWTDRSPDVRLSPMSLYFFDTERGILSVRDNTGCPNDCQNLCRAVLTTDGGKTWTEKTYPGLYGVLNHLQPDSKGNLYAHLWTSSDSSSLVKSTDQGESFEVIYSADEYGSQNITFSHELIDDVIYASANVPGVILAIDTEGNLIQRMVSGSPGNAVGFRKLGAETFLMATTHGTWLSRDAGNSWTLIREGWSKILYANLPNDQKPEILLSVITGYCPTDVVRGKDVLAYTNDGGESWTDSEFVENMTMGFSWHPIPAGENGTMVLLLNELLKFTK